MKKRLMILLTIISLPLNVFATNKEIVSKSAIVVNNSNDEILFEKNINDKSPIASLTKIMTTLIALENIEDFNKKVVVQSSDLYNLYGYQVIGLKI